MEKNKQFKNELLMETLRVKSSKTFPELAKNVRLSLLERRYNIDAVEKQTLQTALDNLQNNIQIKNRGHLVERLETITRRSFLKFTDNANGLFISSDMFYLEILLDPAGKVNDVKVHHEASSESASDPHIIEVLRKGDFIDFTQQLEGFQSIYQLNAESKIKSKAFIAIQALESDLLNIFNIESLQNYSAEVLLITSSVGLLTNRRGGNPMRLTYFVRPTELLNIEHKRMDPLVNALQAAAASKKPIGNSLTVELEAAAPSNKLQISPLLLKSGKNDFTFSPINVHNSTMLPAAFVLRLNQAIPLITQFYDEIKKITNNLGVFGEENVGIKLENPEVPKEAPASLINLIVNSESQGTYENGQKGLFLNLADQAHCYFISENIEMTGTMIKSIQFTEPSQVIKIIKLLRQQAIFNALIASCVRKQTAHDFDCESYMFEINVVSLQFIQVFVEHPIKQSIVTVELNLSDIKQIGCKINGSDQQFDSKLENYIYRVFQKTMSIPMVLRSLIKYWENEAQEIQRLHQKRLFNSGIYGGSTDSKSKGDDKKDDGRKCDTGNSMDESTYSGNRQNSFDICGTNKNEIFFKAIEQKNLDVFDQHSNKMSRVMSFEMDNGGDDMMLGRNSMTNEMSSEGTSSILGVSSKKGLGHSIKGSASQKSLDVFEFNDPSPPPAMDTVMVPMQSPLLDGSRKIPTPRASPIASAPFNLEKRVSDLEMIPLKPQISTGEFASLGQTSSSLTTVGNVSSNFAYEKPKSEKKKKRKREEGDSSSAPMAKKKSSDSLSSSPSKKSSGTSSQQFMGKPSASFKPKKSPAAGMDSMGDLSFLNFGADQQTIPSPLPSPQSLLKGGSSSQANRKNSLSAVINKLKSSANDAMSAPEGEDKKSEYQIKSSGSDGIKITFNKTKSSKGSKSPKHTGLKPGVNSGPASAKKSSQSSKSSSQKLLYQKSSSSGSLTSSGSTIPSPKSSSQPGKPSSKDNSPFSGFSGNSNEMLKNMLNIASQAPRTDLVKAFDKKFQIPKLSARGKSDDKPSLDAVQNFNPMHPRSAPNTPIQSSIASPTMDFMRDVSSSSNHFQMSQQNFFTNAQQQDQQRQSKKLFKSVSSEQLYGESLVDKARNSNDLSDADFQALFRSQPHINESSVIMQSGPQATDSVDVFNDDIMSFIGNEI